MSRTVPAKAITIPPHAQRVFQGVIFDVYQWPQKLFDGSDATFEMLKRPDTVLILCVKDDKIVFITEEQPGRPAYTRLPGGRVDAGEAWETAVKRECSEELRLAFNNWRLISVRQPIAKAEWFVATYLATDCSGQHAPHLDAGEKIEVMEFTFEEAKAFIAGESDPLNDYVAKLFAGLNSLEDLLALPAFQGKEIA